VNSNIIFGDIFFSGNEKQNNLRLDVFERHCTTVFVAAYCRLQTQEIAIRCDDHTGLDYIGGYKFTLAVLNLWEDSRNKKIKVPFHLPFHFK